MIEDISKNNDFLSNVKSSDDENIDFSYTLRQSWVDELGIQGAFLFSIISTLSTKFGYCYISDDELSRRLNCSLRTVERSIKDLDEKKWIFRNTYSIGKGSKRHIVTHDNALSYWKNFLSKPSIPKSVRILFLKHFFKSELFPEPPSSPPDKNGGSLSAAKNGGSFTNVNKDIKEKQRIDSVADFSSVEKELNVAKELNEAGFEGDLVKLGVAYWKDNQPILQTKGNPMGFLVWALKSGKISEWEAKKKKTIDAKDNLEAQVEKNKQLGRQFYKEVHRKCSTVDISIDEVSVYLGISHGCVKSASSLGWYDKDFKSKLKKMRDLVDAELENLHMQKCWDEETPDPIGAGGTS